MYHTAQDCDYLFAVCLRPSEVEATSTQLMMTLGCFAAPLSHSVLQVLEVLLGDITARDQHKSPHQGLRASGRRGPVNTQAFFTTNYLRFIR